MRRVSYVVTVYNKALYLPAVIAGLRAQAGAFEREFVFVDDGSTDDSLGVLERETQGLANVSILTQPNQGPAVALNRGFAAASGDIVKPVDGDDVLFPWATAALLEAMEALGRRWAFANAEASPTYDPRAPEAFSPPPAPSARPQSVALLERSIRRPQTNPSVWLAETAAVREVGGCDERVFVQDYTLELRLARAFPAAELAAPVHATPASLEGRVQSNQAQILHDTVLALGFLLKENEGLSGRLRRLALTRATHRAWSWARRVGGAPLWSRAFALDALAHLGLVSNPASAAFAAAEAFRERGRIRSAPVGARAGL